ncbi:hypothetical protein [Pueribacillus sp. YX66]|uniref:hypothetical protein n=1 Tax=Pueribacillus sp. YX66 TaxID=3229242 RepID=UPI00358D5EE9
MGFTLEYNRVFYRHNDLLIFVNKLGDSNVYDHDGLRSRDWNIISIGKEEKMWTLIGERIGSVAGGMLQRAVGWSDSRYFTPLEYVKMYR